MSTFERRLRELIAEAAAAEMASSERYASVLEAGDENGRVLATVLVVSGSEHDLMCEFIEDRLPGAVKVRAS